MSDSKISDVLLVGAGIMSATLGVLLKKLDPSLEIQIFERLDHAAAESSDAWNNAGTGHSAFCELNYTPELDNGDIDLAKALRIAEQFELSKQFWASLVIAGDLPDPNEFIRKVPHLAFVHGQDNVAFLRKRFESLIQYPLFEGMEFTTDHKALRSWAPLIMQGRDPKESIAATRMTIGNDVNFGKLTRSLLSHLQNQSKVSQHFGQEVVDFRYKDDGIWRVKVRDLDTDEERIYRSRFVFVGAGGGALELLDASGIPEGDGYGGFPVSGQFLRCTNKAVISQHEAKVYGKAALGAPPMSVPHLDTRWIDGERQLLFGPYAGFSTKFLKKGSYLDLLRSIDIDNIVPVIKAGLDNLDLSVYLVGQVMLDKEERMGMLRAYFPDADEDDWEAHIAGQRVQIIKRDADRGGRLQFGTEIVTGKNGSIAALLGASPGASTAVAIMLDVIERCFSDALTTDAWQTKLNALCPSYGQSLADDATLCRKVRADSLRTLGISADP